MIEPTGYTVCVPANNRFVRAVSFGPWTDVVWRQDETSCLTLKNGFIVALLLGREK